MSPGPAEGCPGTEPAASGIGPATVARPRFPAGLTPRGHHGLLAVLAPDVIRRADPAALPSGRPAEIRGAGALVKEASWWLPRDHAG